MTDWHDSTYTGDFVVRVGSGGAIETNPDPSDSGNTWTAQTSGTSENLYGVAFNGIVLVAVGATGIGLVSDDAILWTQVTTQSSEDLNSIAVGGNVFIAVGNVGTIVQSQNGTVWTTIASGITDNLWDVAIGNAVYVAVGDNDAIVTGNVTSANLEVHLLETITYDGTVDTLGTFNHAQEDGMLMDEGAVYEGDVFFVNQVEDVLFAQIGGFSAGVLNSSLLDTAGMHDRIFDSFEKLMEVIGITDATLADYHKMIIEALGIDDAGAASMLFQTILSEAAVFDETTAQNGFFVVVTEDQIAIDDELTTNQIFDLLVSEDLNALAGFTLREEGSYLGVAMNTKNNAVTEYQDFDFNSLAKIGKHHYGCKADGIYLLNGADDAGTDIAAVVRFLASEEAGYITGQTFTVDGGMVMS